MYVLEHALLNLGRNKGRNILLGVIIFAIITASVITLAISNTTEAVISETRYTFERMVRVAPRQIIYGEESVTLEQFHYFAESEYLVGADIRENPMSMSGIEAIYFLKQPEMLYDFEAELRNKGLPDNYSVVTENATFKNAIGHLENLQNITFTFLIIVLVLGAFIMVLLSVISIRERKYEIGVLRAMGMKKKTVALGLWIEILTITCICFALGMGAGAMLSQPISNMILAGQTDSINVDVSVSILTAIQILGVSILLASIAGIVSISRITKCEPVKILMERN
ncbi:MAG: ABC transporter permease [Oscillospiraceae bacterium]|nr:ABC transporter permease [Oscillospiraceae bacterium]